MHPMHTGFPLTTSYTWMIWIKLHWGDDLDLREIGSIGHLEIIPNTRLVKLHKVLSITNKTYVDLTFMKVFSLIN
jgi:hypothetical protein